MKTFGFAGWSGSGKTTLIEQLIPRFVKRGLRVSLGARAREASRRYDVQACVRQMEALYDEVLAEVAA